MAPPHAPFRAGQRVTIQDLPVELSSLIISYLPHEKGGKTLKSCSCLSPTWRDLVLPHLFASLKPIEVNQLHAFATFIESNRHIAVLVKHLRISGDGSTSSNQSDPCPNAVSMDAAGNLSFIQTLARLRSLEYLQCSSVCLLPHDSYQLSKPLKLRRFIWDQCHNETKQTWCRSPSTAILKILSSFTADILDITVAMRAEPSEEVPIHLKRRPAFKSVIIRGTRSLEVFGSLRKTLCRDTLRSLTLCVGVAYYVDLLGRFIQGVGRELEHLRLNFCNMGRFNGWTGSAMEALNLGSCLSLRTLGVSMLWGRDTGPDFGYVSAPALATILAQAPPSLEEVRIQIFRHNPAAPPRSLIDVQELPAVERVLAQAAFPSLRAFVFELTREEGIDECRALLEDALPTLRERGVLVVERLVHETVSRCLDKISEGL